MLFFQYGTKACHDVNTGGKQRRSSLSSKEPSTTKPRAGGTLKQSASTCWDGGYTGSLSPLVHILQDSATTLSSVARNLGSQQLPSLDKDVNEKEARKQLLYLRLRDAETFKDWHTAAEELDVLEDNDTWKAEPESDDYDAHIVRARLKQLDEARISCDASRMLLLIRTALTRELGNMGNIKLYRHSHVGTKHLIERYINSALETLETILKMTSAGAATGLDPRNTLEQIILARQSFGRSALLLSGGATFGMSHIGVIKSLWEGRMLPRIISGASAGSIVGATLCVSTDEEIPQLLQDFPHGDLDVFDRIGEDDNILMKVARFLKKGAWIDIEHLIRVMRELLGDITFQEAYNRTRRILNICVSSASVYELPRLLNYVTAPNVLIWSAVAASCSVPFIFSSTSLLAKDPKTGAAGPWNPSPQRWIDGSVDNDLPMTRLAEMFNVNHFIVSQVNPHVVPFLAKEERALSQTSAKAVSTGPGWLHSITDLARTEALHRMQILAELGILPNAMSKLRSVLSQKYSGDITILPEISYADFPRMLSNPNTDFMLQATLRGERATWPKMSRIRNHCAIELALDDAVQRLRTRVVFSPSQVNLRLNTTSSIASSSWMARARQSRSKSRDEARRHRKVQSGVLENGAGMTAMLKKSSLSTQTLRQNRSKSIGSRASRRSSAETRPRPPSLHLPFLSLSSTNNEYSTSPSPSGSPGSSISDSEETADEESYFPQQQQQQDTRLFPFASQPATPHARASNVAAPQSTQARRMSLTKFTPRGENRQSSPETLYKRIYHN